MTSFEFFEDPSLEINMTSVPMMEGIPDHPGSPKGTDTVPAWLTPGEYVMNAEATRMFEPQIEAMNDAGRAVQARQGGSIPEYSAHGGPVYLAEGSGNWFTDIISGLFSSGTPKSGEEALAAVTPSYGNAAPPKPKPVASSQGVTGPTRPDPTMSNQMYMDFLKDKEGFREEAYLDSAGVPTIGYGFTKGVKMGDTMTQEVADSRLLEEMARTDQDYNNLVTADLNPNQEAAVKSLLYNIGGPQFEVSKARAALNEGDFETFKKEAAEFRMADGKVIPGLENRRRDEMELFFKPYNNSEDTSGVKKVGTLFDNDVFEDDLGEYINGPDGPVYLDNNQSQSVSRVNQTPPPVDNGSPYGGDVDMSGPEALANIVKREAGSVHPYGPDMPVDPGLLAAVEAQKGVPPMDDAPIDFSQYSDGPFGPKVPDAIGPRSEDQQIRDDVLLGKTDDTTDGSWFDRIAGMFSGDDSDPRGKPVGEGNKFDIDGDGFLSKDEIRAVSQSISEKPTAPNLAIPMPGVSKNQIVITEPSDLVPRNEQILNEMIESNAKPEDIAAQADKIAVLKNLPARQEAFSNVVEAQNKIKPIDDQIEDLQTQIERLEAAGLYERANALRSEVASLNAQKPELQAELDAANAAQDELYRDAILRDGTVIPNVGKVAADVIERDGDIPPPPLDLEGGVGDGVPETDEPPKPEPSTTPVTGMEDEYDEELDSTTQTVIDRIINDEEGSKDKTIPEGTTAEDAMAAGSGASDEDVDKAKGFFEGILGDLFDKGELQRMAIMYVGGRMLGGSHNGSLNFAAKQYVQRVDQKAADKKAEEKALEKEERVRQREDRKAFNKHIQSMSATGKRSAASIEAYRKSYDPKTGLADASLLKDVVKPTPTNMDGPPEYMYHNDTNQRVLVQKVKVGDSTTGTQTKYVYASGPKAGEVIDSWNFHKDKSLVPKTQEYYDYRKKIAGEVREHLEKLIAANTVKGEGGEDDYRPTDVESIEQADKVAKYMLDNKVPPLMQATLTRMAYENMVADGRRRSADLGEPVKHREITKFMDGAYISISTGNPNLFNVPDSDKPGDLREISNLTSRLVAQAKQDPKMLTEGKKDHEIAKHIYSNLNKLFLEGKYSVPDPDPSNPNKTKEVVITDEMRAGFIKEAKKRNTSPFQLWFEQYERDINRQPPSQ